MKTKTKPFSDNPEQLDLFPETTWSETERALRNALEAEQMKLKAICLAYEDMVVEAFIEGYAEGVEDAEKAAGKAIRKGVFIEKIPDHIHALLTEKIR